VTRFAELLAEPPDAMGSARLWTASSALQCVAPISRRVAAWFGDMARVFEDGEVWATAPVLVAARGQRPPIVLTD